MAGDLGWLYIVIFLAIPLVRILPRIIRKLRDGQPMSEEYSDRTTQSWNVKTAQESVERPQSSEMLVLGQMIAGAKTFENIQKYTGIAAKKLDSILQDLESRGMIRVEHKQGMLGAKIELHPTSKGLREFHN